MENVTNFSKNLREGKEFSMFLIPKKENLRRRGSENPESRRMPEV